MNTNEKQIDSRPALPRLFVAIDTPHLDVAETLAKAFHKIDGVGLKVGMTFYSTHGPQGVRRVARELPLFLDLKFHDIPKTVYGSVKAATSTMIPKLMTVHASGGVNMLNSAKKAADEHATRPRVVAVTILTSLDANDLNLIGMHNELTQQSLRLAKMSQDAKLDGVVCSGHEVSAIRDLLGDSATLIVPGVRPHPINQEDQKRTLSPKEAFDRGATSIVIGRPITLSDNPVQEVENILKNT